MINLAGRWDAEKYVMDELKTAGIEVVREAKNLNNEVSVPLAGQLGKYHFTRAWYYYIVSGNVPLKVAQELYKSKTGKRDIRVVGHCGCPPPENWVTWLDDDGVKLITLEENEEITALFKS